jgi:hypothetical protein
MAMAKGLQIDTQAQGAGRHDGARGAPWRPPLGCDVLSYALGYREGEMFGGGQ